MMSILNIQARPYQEFHITQICLFFYQVQLANFSQFKRVKSSLINIYHTLMLLFMNQLSYFYETHALKAFVNLNIEYASTQNNQKVDSFCLQNKYKQMANHIIVEIVILLNFSQLFTCQQTILQSQVPKKLHLMREQKQQQYQFHYSACDPNSLVILKNPQLIAKNIFGSIRIIFVETQTFDPKPFLSSSQQLYFQLKPLLNSVRSCKIDQFVEQIMSQQTQNQTIFIVTGNQLESALVKLDVLNSSFEDRTVKYFGIEKLLGTSIYKSERQIVERIVMTLKYQHQFSRLILKNWLLFGNQNTIKYNACIKSMLNTKYNYHDRMKLCYKYIKCICEAQKSKMLYQTVDHFFEQFSQKKLIADSILSQYTSESFFYKLINNLLRSSSDPTQLFWVQPFVAQLYYAIKQKYNNYEKKGDFTCYRGAYVSDQQLQMLKDNQQMYIQLSGFVSTSLNECVAKEFIENLLIVINVPMRDQKSNDHGYVYLNNGQSFIVDQEQILFNVLNIFKIEKIISSQNMHYIYLTYCYEVQDQKNDKYYHHQQFHNQGDALKFIISNAPKDTSKQQKSINYKKQTEIHKKMSYLLQQYSNLKQKLTSRMINNYQIIPKHNLPQIKTLTSEQLVRFLTKGRTNRQILQKLKQVKINEEQNIHKQPLSDSSNFYNYFYKQKKSTSLAMLCQPQKIAQLLNAQYKRILFFTNKYRIYQSFIFSENEFVKTISQIKDKLSNKECWIIGVFSLGELSELLASKITQDFNIDKVILFMEKNTKKTYLCSESQNSTDSEIQQPNNLYFGQQRIFIWNRLMIQIIYFDESQFHQLSEKQLIKKGRSFFFNLEDLQKSQCTLFSYIMQAILNQKFNKMEVFEHFAKILHLFSGKNYKQGHSNAKINQSSQQQKQKQSNQILNRYRIGYYQQLRKEQILKIYTGQNVIYKITNLTRLAITPSQLIFIQPLIKNIYTCINEIYHSKNSLYQKQFICYRGAFLNNQQINQMKNNLGCFCKSRCFLNCTFSMATAKLFSTNVLFAIEVPPHKSTKNIKQNNPFFAEIQDYSFYKKQQEILFNPLSLFKIIQVIRHQYDKDFTEIHLKYVPVPQSFLKIQTVNFQSIILCQSVLSASIYIKLWEGIKNKIRKKILDQGQIYLNIIYNSQNLHILLQGIKYWSYRLDIVLFNLQSSNRKQCTKEEYTQNIYYLFSSINSFIFLLIKQKQNIELTLKSLTKIWERVNIHQIITKVIEINTLTDHRAIKKKIKIIEQILNYCSNLTIINEFYLRYKKPIDIKREIKQSTELIQRIIQKYVKQKQLTNKKGTKSQRWQKIQQNTMKMVLIRYKLYKKLACTQLQNEHENNEQQSLWDMMEGMHKGEVIKMPKRQEIFKQDQNLNDNENNNNICECDCEANRDTDNTDQQDKDIVDKGGKLIQEIGHINMLRIVSYLLWLLSPCCRDTKEAQPKNKDYHKHEYDYDYDYVGQNVERMLRYQRKRVLLLYQHMKVWFYQKYGYEYIVQEQLWGSYTEYAQCTYMTKGKYTNINSNANTNTNANGRTQRFIHEHMIKDPESKQKMAYVERVVNQMEGIYLNLLSKQPVIGRLQEQKYDQEQGEQEYKYDQLFEQIEYRGYAMMKKHPLQIEQQNEFACTQAYNEVIDQYIGKKLGSILHKLQPHYAQHDEHTDMRGIDFYEVCLAVALNQHTSHMMTMLRKLNTAIASNKVNQSTVQNVKNIVVLVITTRYLLNSYKQHINRALTTMGEW